MVEELIQELAKSGAIKILRVLKNGDKRMIEIVKETGLDKSTVWRRLKEFEDVYYLIETQYNREIKAPIYRLTPTAKEIVEKLEELEKAYNSHLSSIPPKEPEEFLGGR